MQTKIGSRGGVLSNMRIGTKTLLALGMMVAMIIGLGV
jgi:hypothetical protein